MQQFPFIFGLFLLFFQKVVLEEFRAGARRCSYKNHIRYEKIISCNSLASTDFPFHVNGLINGIEDPYGNALPIRIRSREEKIVYLHLSNISFSNNVLSKSVFMADYAVHVLILEESQILDIQPNSFRSKSFQNLFELELRDLKMTRIKFGTFNGLTYLRSLTITDSDLQSFDKNVLEPCKELSKLTILDCPLFEMTLDGLTGTTILYNILRFRASGNNFENTITRFTFFQLPLLMELFLSNNMIRTIGEDAFHAESMPQINHIDLSHNQLKTILPNVLNPHFILYLRVKLNNNPWDCDCRIEHLRRVIQKSKNPDAFSELWCDGPKSVRKMRLIHSSDLCDSVAEQSKDDIPTNELNNDEDFVELTNCPESMHLNESTQKIELDALPNGKYNLTLRNLPSNSIIVLMGNDGSINCFTKDGIEKDDEICMEPEIEPNTAYRLCVMSKGDSTVSPLDCIAFTSDAVASHIVPDIWIAKEHRMKTIIFCIISQFVSFLLGAGVTFLVKRRQRSVLIEQMEFNPAKRSSSVHSIGSWPDVGASRPERSSVISPNGQYLRVNKDARSSVTRTKSDPIKSIDSILLDALPPPPLPSRISYVKSRKSIKLRKGTDCCDSDKCECYCELDEL